jgi:transposase
MATDASFLIPPSLHVAALLLSDDGVTIRAVSEAEDVRCPICGERSARIHRRSTRTLGDLPWARFAVHLHVEVRRFFCANPTCPRQIFAERLAGIAPAAAHRTDRQRTRLTDLALALGIGRSTGGSPTGRFWSTWSATARSMCSPTAPARAWPPG